MSDIVSRLLLDTKQYDANLQKSKKGSNDFANDVAGKLSGAVAKFAAGIGVAVGGVEAFNKIMGSSQTLGDTWNNTINACKGTVDAFFFSLSSNNWDAFNQGLIRTIENMYQLSALKDQLSDARLSMGFEQRRFEREYVKLEGIIDNEKTSKSERSAAFAEMQKLVADFKQRVEATGKGAAETLVKEMNTKFGKDFTLGDLETYIREVNNEFLNTETLQRLNEYKKQISDILKAGEVTTVTPYGSYTQVTESAKQQVEALKAANPFLEKMRLFQEDGDASRKGMVEDYEYMLEILQRADDYFKRHLEKQNKIASLNKVGAVVVSTQQVANPYPGGALSPQRQSLASLATMPDMGKIQPLPITKQAVKDVDDYVNSINALSNVLTALNTQTVEGAAGWLSWAGSLMTASAMAVDSIRQVVAAKTAEGAASAGAEAAKTPFVGWLLVGGAVMSALAAFASIPSFAEGGVVPGSNFRDGIAARLSSGEMVINPADQKKLFDSIHSGNLGGGGSSRSVITGEQIVTVVNNYGRRTGRGTILKG
jgi:hypothetical protein